MSRHFQSTTSQKEKDIKSALCYIPPSHHWDKIQEIRCYHEKGFVRWPPHINLLYPFWKDENNNHQEAVSILQDITSKYKPFKIHFNKIFYIERGNYIRVGLAPSPESSSELMQLQKDILQAFPDCRHLNKPNNENIHNIPLGQWRNKEEAFRVISSLKDTFDIVVTVEQLSVISRPDFITPFQITHILKLGKERINIKTEINYVATVCSEGIRNKGYQSYYGIGEEEKEGIWSFGYGSNMSAEGLAKKTIVPIESMPGILFNYRLKFDIYSTFANVGIINDTNKEEELNENIPNNVHGVLHKYSQIDFSKLTNVERLYRPVEVMVKPYNGGPDVRAVVFSAGPMVKLGCPQLRTVRNYMKLLIEGAKCWELDGDYVKWLESIETVDVRDVSDLDSEYRENSKGERINVYLRRVGAWNATEWKSIVKKLGVKE